MLLTSQDTRSVVCGMLSILAEYYDGTIEYTDADRHEYVVSVLVWCREHMSQHVCCPSNKESCPVCLDTFVDDSNVLKLGCNHTMHIECAERWFSACTMSRRTVTCPLCKFVVPCPIFEIVAEDDFSDQIVVTTNKCGRFMQWIRKICCLWFFVFQ